ncbi:hypothetical protein C1645_823484 [Glomus cerebriforme]|uniref:Galactose oxidase n=1 Tax=Glomus cerebriforme TaxID=658196 RepID=A0A397SZ84_9GLOM|nr:hypothetical protein C1645_823484 [Glomus cerebriforme]
MNIVAYGEGFTPRPRLGQAAVLVENKIYYIGGVNYNESESGPSDFFYFDTSSYIWTDLQSQGVNIPFTVWHTANIGGVNEDSIFIIGGTHYDEIDNAYPNYIYRFDTKTNVIDIPEIQGKAPIHRKGVNSISYEGKIYMFGGQIEVNGKDIYLNNLFDILDTVNLNWQVGSLVNSPVASAFYTATLVNGVIYYIGGTSGPDNFSPMTQIYQYDIVGNTWSLKTATAVDLETIPGSRIGHSAVLVLNSKIVVYGGSYYNNDTPYDVPAKNTMVVLDTNTLVWSIPQLDDVNVPKLTSHSATVQFGTMMTVAFGNYTDKPNSEDQTNKSMFTFYFYPDMVKWQEMLLPTSANTNTTTSKSQIPAPSGDFIPDTSQTSSKIIIVCTSIGSVAVVLTILVVLTLVYKHMKKIKNEDKDQKDPKDLII